MPSTELLSEEDVKNELGIKDFRSLKKDKIIEFVSMIPNMDKEVAKACIAQFGNFKEYSNTIVGRLYDLLDTALKDNFDGSIHGYQTILDTLQSILDKNVISIEDRHYIIDKMVEVASRIEHVEQEKQAFKENTIKVGGGIAAFALSIGAAILGVKIIGNGKKKRR